MLGLGIGIPLHFRRRGGGSALIPIDVAYKNSVEAEGGVVENINCVSAYFTELQTITLM